MSQVNLSRLSLYVLMPTLPAECLACVGVGLPVGRLAGRPVHAGALVFHVDLDGAAGHGRPVPGPLALVADRIGV